MNCCTVIQNARLQKEKFDGDLTPQRKISRDGVWIGLLRLLMFLAQKLREIKQEEKTISDAKELDCCKNDLFLSSLASLLGPRWFEKFLCEISMVDEN